MIYLKDMPAHSRVWIYQSSRKFSEVEVEQLKTKSEEFISQWTSHDQLMHASIELFYNRFLVVCVDEKTAPASGCGIDKSIRFIRQLECELQTTLLNRMLVAYKKDNAIFSCTLPEFEKLIEQKKIDANTIVFNNLVLTKGEMGEKWEIPLSESWHNRMLIN